MARPWVFPVALDPTSSAPLFLQIARAITADIRRGRLRPAAVLPGSRTLARNLGVHRNTVLASYRDLQDAGWVISTQRSLRVSEALPRQERPAPRPREKARPGFEFAAVHLEADLDAPRAGVRSGRGAIVHVGGLPDPRLVPVIWLARAFRRALRSKGALEYAHRYGDPSLRRALAAILLEARGIDCNEDDILVTGGSQMGIDLVARALVRPGDVVAVEDPGYPPAWDALRLAGAELAPVAVDEGGLRTDALEALAKKKPLRAIYTTPHHQFPTTVTMSPARRLALLAFARARGVAIVEDDYDFEFHYAGRPIWPLASSDEAGVVIYVGTLSKVLAPGMRLGFVTGTRPVVDTLAARQSRIARGNPALERAIAELFEDGLLQRHARKMRRVYESRRDLLAALLRQKLGGVVSFAVPAGGMSLWLAVDPELDVELWADRALARGISFSTGRTFDFRHRVRPTLRLGYSGLDERELHEMVRQMAGALESSSNPRSRRGR
ncbi:MAG TPA: PLP-dependent aminotransferase family protein [Polyangiaceae bacterium]|nr:PLP-dependent aminotransferase family protein [Polyangiaceae bacterium]